MRSFTRRARKAHSAMRRRNSAMRVSAINEQPARFRFLSGFLFDFVELRRMFKPPKRFALEIHRALGRLLN